VNISGIPCQALSHIISSLCVRLEGCIWHQTFFQAEIVCMLYTLEGQTLLFDIARLALLSRGITVFQKQNALDKQCPGTHDSIMRSGESFPHVFKCL
jgi:hypothetical protein